MLKENFNSNVGSSVNKRTKIQQLRWGNTTQMNLLLLECKEGIDLIVAADVVFEHDPHKKNETSNLHSANVTFRLLHQTMQYLSTNTKKLFNKVPEIYLAYKQRYSREGSFFSLMKQSFEVSSISRRDVHPDFLKAKLKIYRFILKEEHPKQDL
jgi:hypothetical protein